MQVTLRLAGGLHKYVAGASEAMVVDLAEGETVRDVLQRAGIRQDLVSVVLLDGDRSSLDHPVSDGQEVTVMALMGGGRLTIGAVVRL